MDDRMLTADQYLTLQVLDSISDLTWVTANAGAEKSKQSPRPKPAPRPKDLRAERDRKTRQEQKIIAGVGWAERAEAARDAILAAQGR